MPGFLTQLAPRSPPHLSFPLLLSWILLSCPFLPWLNFPHLLPASFCPFSPRTYSVPHFHLIGRVRLSGLSFKCLHLFLLPSLSASDRSAPHLSNKCLWDWNPRITRSPISTFFPEKGCQKLLSLVKCRSAFERSGAWGIQGRSCFPAWSPWTSWEILRPGGHLTSWLVRVRSC